MVKNPFTPWYGPMAEQPFTQYHGSGHVVEPFCLVVEQSFTDCGLQIVVWWLNNILYNLGY